MRACFCCHRPAVYFDRQINQWVCEGNSDCRMSRRATVTDREHRCENCKQRPAVTIFDNQLVCARCHRALEERLVRHG